MLISAEGLLSGRKHDMGGKSIVSSFFTDSSDNMLWMELVVVGLSNRLAQIKAIF